MVKRSLVRMVVDPNSLMVPCSIRVFERHFVRGWKTLLGRLLPEKKAWCQRW